VSSRSVRLMLATLLLAAVTGPAHADEPRMLVSRSASGPFTDQLAGPLLTGVGRVVPLDETTGTFYVKNATSASARTTVAVVYRGESNDLTGGLAVTVDAGGPRTTGSLPPDGRPCDLVVTGPTVAPGEVQAVAVGVAVGDLEGQRGMGQRFSLDLDVTMSHLGRSGAVAGCGEQAAAAEPTGPDCTSTAVVTLTGTPRCVPSAVDAGLVPRDPATAVAESAAWIVVAGGLLLLLAARRRRTTAAASAD